VTVADPVLITGCSTGIGRATATALVAAGRLVYASARSTASLDDLASAGARPLALDVTSEESMRAAVAAVEAEHGRVGTLVNNAGFGAYGPVEEVGLDEVRRQFETNVFGLGRMCQLVLPAMRARGGGRIVNVSSMGGRLSFPAGGWYHASKYAVEGLSDVLRVEVAGFGVDVVLIEPGLIRTGFESVASSGLEAETTEPSGPYARLRQVADEVMRHGYQGRSAAGPDAVARVIVRAVTARRPRTRYVVTPTAKLLVQTRRWGGDHVWDTVVRRMYRIS
jgi:NAD(P)-dependent dehydrogenase (short-subunit alcohol dehydrogenase family)